MCDVNTFTSLEKSNGNYKFDKLDYVRKGQIYAVSKNDCSLPLFSGVDKRVIHNIPLSKIKDVGKNSIKRRHHHYIQKYVK